jgi:hypothetical protein
MMLLTSGADVTLIGYDATRRFFRKPRDQNVVAIASIEIVRLKVQALLQVVQVVAI